MTATAIECKSLSKQFGDPPTQILKSISFNIEKGEFLAITGRSGSGKSTLLYVISGLDNPTSGDVIISGNNIHTMESKELHTFRNMNMGFVFQFHYLLPELTALENVLMPARKFKKEKEKEEQAQYLIDQFDISRCKNKFPSQMSGGEQQRVAIARSLIMDPQFLFADEPTGNLDSINGEKVLKIFEYINKEHGTTILFVTHEMDFAKRASRQIHLADGEIVRDNKFKKKK